MKTKWLDVDRDEIKWKEDEWGDMHAMINRGGEWIEIDDPRTPEELAVETLKSEKFHREYRRFMQKTRGH